jgi:hypothetical protein
MRIRGKIELGWLDSREEKKEGIGDDSRKER